MTTRKCHTGEQLVAVLKGAQADSVIFVLPAIGPSSLANDQNSSGSLCETISDAVRIRY